MTALRMEGVCKRYGAVRALDGIELSVPRGSRTAIVGASGSGKTTLLRMIAGFEAPDAGRIMLGDRTLADGPRSIPTHRREIGIVTQDGALFPHLSIADNIAFGMGRGASGKKRRVAELMAMVGLDERMLGRRPDELSGGQQQRVALARALARRPQLMLLDEPFSALDTGLREQTRKAVGDLLADAGVTTILVTHDQAEALSFADQVAVMREGRFQQVGTPRELYLRPNDPVIARFLGDAVILPAFAAGGVAECAFGRLAVDDPHRAGAVRVMLRCEQIVLRPGGVGAAGSRPAAADALAKVIAVDFGGAMSAVTLDLEAAAAPAGATPASGDPAAEALVLRGAGFGRLSAGDVVRIEVTGKAHVFPPEARSEHPSNG